MRLLRTSTFHVEGFFAGYVPPYAVLSHTWGDNELSFQDLQEDTILSELIAVKERASHGGLLGESDGTRSGLLKIVGCALQAERDGLEYVWCDTCCINKMDSSELTESINSMYAWYKGQTCYAYLADVPHSLPIDDTARRSAFARSRWFSRGWTLQELIAPASISFFDEAWAPVGTRSAFKHLIAETTGIRVEILDGQDPARCSIAERMSWAAHRKTTRTEDGAYCLMGLFQVNMPLIYGEKEKAFLRLQTEIMKTSEDHSLFAWKSADIIGEAYCGLLATSASYFAECGDVRDGHHDMKKPPFAMTNRGISIYLSLYRIRYTPRIVQQTKVAIFFAPLACATWSNRSKTELLGIYLTQDRNGVYNRCYPHLLVSDYEPDAYHFDQKTIYVAQSDIISRPIKASLYRLRIPELPVELKRHGVVMKLFLNKQIGIWDMRERVLTCLQGLGASLYIGPPSGKGLVLLLGIDCLQQGRCAFDDACDTASQSFVEYGPDPKNPMDFAPALLLYRSDTVSKPGPMEEEFFDRRLQGNGHATTLTDKRIKPESQRLHIDQVKRERKRHWDEWISRPRNPTGSLQFETSTMIERPNPRFWQRKTRTSKEKIQMTLYTGVKAVEAEGENRFMLTLSV